MNVRTKQYPNSEAYRTSAAYYDFHVPDNITQIIDFWAFAVQQHADRPIHEILEFGVGTGRIALPLAKAGHRVVGTDGSRRMLDLCRTKASECGANITLREEWMQDFAEVESRDALIAVFGTLAFLVDDHSIRRFLVACHNALRAGGILLLDVANSLEGLTNPWAGTTTTTHDHNGAHMERFVQLIPDCLSGTVRHRDTAVIREAHELKVYHEEFVLRMFSFSELQLLLEPVCFSQLTCYGDWHHRQPMQQPAPRLILVLKK